LNLITHFSKWTSN